MRASRPLGLAAVFSALILGARLFPSPALLDAAAGAPAEGFRLAVPTAHLLLTPFAALGDLAACSSVWQAPSLILWLLAACAAALWAARVEDLKLLLAVPLAAALLAWGVLFPRAAARLEAGDADLLAVDFHSHTSRSHDGRSWFTDERSAAWHEKAGYGAFFVTDHNKREGSGPSWGEELSLHDAHVLLYGAEKVWDNEAYRGLAGLESFFKEAKNRGALAVPSLPEYHQHHAERLETLADWGAAGFEILSASPKGMAVPAAFRARVVELCRARNLFLTTGSDNHGYPAAVCAASFVRVPGARTLDREQRAAAVLAALRKDGFAATRVVARARCLRQPESLLARAFDAPRAVWDAWRSWTLAQSAAALAWLWALALGARRREIRYHDRA